MLLQHNGIIAGLMLIEEEMAKDKLGSATAILDQLRGFFETYDWTPYALAADAEGRIVVPEDPTATQFSLGGAIIRLGVREAKAITVTKALRRASGELAIVFWENKAKGKADVLKLIDEAHGCIGRRKSLKVAHHA